MAVPTYKELAGLAGSGDFNDRVSIAVVTYARYILSENPSTALHQSRSNWARQAIQNPGIVSGLYKAIAMDGAFASQNPLDFNATSDATVQSAVEATLNATVLVF